MIHKRSTPVELASTDILLEGLNPIRGPNLTLSADVDQDTSP